MKKSTILRSPALYVSIGIILFAGYLCAPIIIGIPEIQNKCRPRFTSEFDSTAWKAATFETGIRYGMANKLLANKALIGSTRERVIEMLGQPSRRSGKGGVDETLDYELSSQQQYSASCWLYPWLLLNIESWVLEIQIENDLVTETVIRGT